MEEHEHHRQLGDLRDHFRQIKRVVAKLEKSDVPSERLGADGGEQLQTTEAELRVLERQKDKLAQLEANLNQAVERGQAVEELARNLAATRPLTR